jgi:predicted nucleic acid-binding protein
MIVCNTSPLIALSILDKVDLIGKVVGVVGFILKAKKLGLITEIKPEFIKMRQAGIRISDSIFRESLALAEEIW